MDREVLPGVFWPMANLPIPNTWLIARAKGDTGSIDSAMRQVIHDVDPEIGIVELSTMTNVVGDSLWRERFSALLVGLFATLAVLIASVGLYAVISHAVERRTHELGVRLALGASGAQIARTVLSHGLRVTAIGTVLGALFTVTGGRLLSHKVQVFSNQLQRNDVQAYQVSDLLWMLAAVASSLIILTLLACWGPLRKALAVDPMTILRSE
jgi:ABC-type antimicrobial peptide transport system permease subunit